MDKKKAKRIEELRTGTKTHSLRRISEIICDEYPDEDKALKGNELHGKYALCWEAMALLHGNGSIADVPKEVREEWDC